MFWGNQTPAVLPVLTNYMLLLVFVTVPIDETSCLESKT